MKCKLCQKEFKPYQNMKSQKFCSALCSKRHFYLKNRPILSPPLKKECLQCKKTFITKIKSKIYCSEACRRKHGWQSKWTIKEESHCLVCGTKFFKRFKRNVYCSIECQKKVHKVIQRKFMLNKRQTNLNYKLRHNISSRILLAIKKGTTKSKNTMDLLGCSIPELRQHLEKQFTAGMSGNNYGNDSDNWQIDHIKPCSAFDLTIKEHQYECFNHTNLQPLWKEENNRKGAKLDYKLDSNN